VPVAVLECEKAHCDQPARVLWCLGLSEGQIVVMNASVKIREQRVRRALAEIGMSLRKSPSPDRRDNGSGYVIVDDRNHVSGGRPNLRFEADLKQVEWFAFEHGADYGSHASQPDYADPRLLSAASGSSQGVEERGRELVSN
jgi:hypothetical protein